MGGAAGVVTGEDGRELDNAIVVGLLDASQRSIVQVGRVVVIAIAVGLDTGVDAG